MSCFIVENSTLNRIATLVFSEDSSYEETREDLASLGIKTAGELVQAMYKLNIAAYTYRYPGEPLPGTYRYKKQTGTAVKVVKSIRCWAYQCLEGDINQDPLYVIIDEFKSQVCENIVKGLREYYEAPWE